jgi:hypothetical protein
MEFVDDAYVPLFNDTVWEYFKWTTEESFKNKVSKYYYPYFFNEQGIYDGIIEEEDFDNEINRVRDNQIRLIDSLTSSKEVWANFLSKFDK